MRAKTFALLSAIAFGLIAGRTSFAAPVYSWTGFYVGAYAGYGWGRTTATDVGDSSGTPWYISGHEFSFDPSSFVGGGQVGYNYQFNQFVVGAEADAGYFRLNGSALYDNTPAHSDTSVVGNGGFDATLRGRVGVAFDRVLVYATGGGIFTNASAQVISFGTFISPDTAMHTGWIAGGGLEYVLSPGWSVKGEYLHFDLGKKTVELAGTDSRFELHTTGDMARLGLNYRLGIP